MARNDEKKSVRCSFCGKTAVAGEPAHCRANGVYICDECVRLCMSIIDEELIEPESVLHGAGHAPARPAAEAGRDASAMLDDYIIGQDRAEDGAVRGGVQPL